MKTFFKIVFIVLAAPIISYFLISGVFHSLEYLKGEKYVTYLNANKTVLKDEFNFNEDFYKNQLFMAGEIHGYKKSPELDFKLLKHLNQKVGVKDYMVEVDYSQAYFLNEYLKTGNDSLINFALKEWLVLQGRGMKEYYDMWKNVYAYNNSLPHDKKIYVYGCDVLSDVEVCKSHLKRLLSLETYYELFGEIADLEDLVGKSESFKKDLELQDKVKLELNDNFPEFNHLINTILQTKAGKREPKIFANFKSILSMRNISTEPIFAFYGFAHTLQVPNKSGFKPLARLIKESELDCGKNMVSMNMIYQDSKTVFRSEWLPSFMRNGPIWSEIEFSYDSFLLFYVKGIKDLKRTSKPNSLTIYKMDEKNSPYLNSKRLMEYEMLLPFFKNQTIELQENFSAAEATQYLFFIRNSEAVTPLN